MIHELKIYPEYFHGIINKNKLFELRKDDRAYKVGDLLALNEISDDKTQYTGNSVLCEVTYILDLKDWLNDSEGYVILGIRKLWIKFRDYDREAIVGEPRKVRNKTTERLIDISAAAAEASDKAWERMKERICAEAKNDYASLKAEYFDEKAVDDESEKQEGVNDDD